MNSISKKVSITFVAGALMLGSFASAAFAGEGQYHERSDNELNKSSQQNWDHAKNKKFFTFMNGEQEVPGPGDPDGKGFAKVKIYADQGKVCVHMNVRHIDPATAAHIHQAPKGQAGPVVVDLPKPDANGQAHDCVSADSNKLKEIKENPSGFYVNIHNEPYPNGAVRGQL